MAAATRAWGLRVRAGAPRRSQASSALARFRRVDSDAAKVSLIGAGMKSHPGVAARMFQTLADLGINVRMIATSPIKVSCVIPRDRVEEAVAGLHEAFEAELAQAQEGAHA